MFEAGEFDVATLFFSRFKSVISQIPTAQQLIPAEIPATAEKAAGAGELKVLIFCPVCLQGLSRYSDDNGMDADYIVVELARKLLGEDWMAKFLGKAGQDGIERVLL